MRQKARLSMSFLCVCVHLIYRGTYYIVVVGAMVIAGARLLLSLLYVCAAKGKLKNMGMMGRPFV